MSVRDKIRNGSEALTGRARRRFGEAKGDPWLTVEGRAQQRRGNLRQALEKIKDAFRR